ncbi:TPA: replicative DNA helicase [Clostridium botulinum]|uniref:replicative DNA helicase n=1 Tax=Clostridium botulinum TaxID=1491 RepID=UPI0013F08C2F|nr:replicative DNA helicase [Clostridium botulinum]MBY6798150.1 replicative DNA helicase [Clostridium botulinum]MBY6867876.1 replicative DNA helicase [Clostridium botulinum]NFI47969.1 replicative DNA helicase [Clostridium botulinum]NFJ91984.1 replicative DNA helicase [Clostridium botulinum]NFR74470.1 replicative DNA helicase [Clostridium botulinum]
MLPHNLEAEINILGSILIENDIINDISEILISEDFYSKPNKILYSKMLDMHYKNIAIDTVTLSNTLGTENLKAIGGISYITEIASSVITISNFKSYADIVKDKAKRRKVIQVCHEALEEAKEKDIKSIAVKLEDALLEINSTKKEEIFTDEELMNDTLAVIQKNYENGGEIPGMKTGLKSLDKATNGLKRGELIVIAGRPSMGKTCLALNIGSNMGKKVGLFELEMGKEDLGMRRLAAKTLINGYKLQQGKMNDKEWARLSTRANEMAYKNNVFTDTSSCLTMLEIKSKCKKIKIKYGLDVVIIDHIGLIEPSNKNESKNNQISEITRQAKIIAKDLDVAVICLSQLSRAPETRTDKRPILSDLRDSGSIEQDADLIMFVYRDEYYDNETEDKGIMEVIIGKQRNGKTGTLRYAYKPEYQLIAEMF